jgi:hypothetical protein
VTVRSPDFIERHYALNEFRATVRVADEAPLEYLDGFLDRDDPGRTAVALPRLDIEPAVPPRRSDWPIDVEDRRVWAGPTADGYAVWSVEGDRYHAWTAARRLLRDLWLVRRRDTSPLAFLHASAVDDGRNLVAFIGDKRAGKTSLMLDATLRRGWRLVTNDCLIVFAGDAGWTASGMPTYVGIRSDVADRYDGLLRAGIAGDAANGAAYTRWRSGGLPAESESKLYLSQGAISRPALATVPLADRTVTVAAIGFAGPGRPTAVRVLDRDPVAFLRANLKSVAFMDDRIRRSHGALDTDPRSLARLTSIARFVYFRHTGDSRPLLDQVKSEAWASSAGAAGPLRGRP